MTIHLKVYDKDRTRTWIYGEGLLVIHLALINKHYVPILKLNMYDFLRPYELRLIETFQA
jgi:hypothetical protein